MEQESIFKSIVENSVVGIIAFDQSGTISYVNPVILNFFECDSSDMIGKKVQKMLSGLDSVKNINYHEEYPDDIMATPDTLHEILKKQKDGKFMALAFRVKKIDLNQKVFYVAYIQNITEQRVQEENVRRYTTEIERSNQALRDFAYASSHDLQEPLRKIEAFGEILKLSESDKLSGEGIDYINRMLNASMRMQSLIKGLLSFTRVAFNDKVFEMVDLTKVLKDVLNDLEVKIDESNAKVNYEVLPTIEANPMHIRQLFQNIIANAIKFKRDGIAPIIDIYSHYVQRPIVPFNGGRGFIDYIELYFEDNGIGFDEKDLDKIFNIFQKLGDTKHEGSGIGLAICRNIVICHGGDITAKSQLGKGSLFIIKLPVKQSINMET